MLSTLPSRVETTWPQPTPQKGHTVVVAVAPRVLSGGIAGAHPDCDKAPIATVPVVSPLRNWRRVDRNGPAFAAFSFFPRFTASSSFFILPPEDRLTLVETGAAFVPDDSLYLAHPFWKTCGDFIEVERGPPLYFGAIEQD